MTVENTNKLNLFIDGLYEFHFGSHGGQFIVYLISFIISLGYMIISGILLTRPQQNTVIEGLIIGINNWGCMFYRGADCVCS
jgi:hypothetical protein